MGERWSAAGEGVGERLRDRGPRSDGYALDFCGVCPLHPPPPCLKLPLFG